MVRTIAFSPDGSRIFSGSVDNKIRVWDVKTSKEAMNPPDFTIIENWPPIRPEAAKASHSPCLLIFECFVRWQL
ncbi:hypothetical protein HGRIS_001374 [Hohenbuehelia grisea]|uniref:Transducin n=1 Tax=Hohenbuehelia grisea TaxID=104357 RepID=A0ABR3JP49_9AGAR